MIYTEPKGAKLIFFKPTKRGRRMIYTIKDKWVFEEIKKMNGDIAFEELLTKVRLFMNDNEIRYVSFYEEETICKFCGSTYDNYSHIECPHCKIKLYYAGCLV